MRRSSFLFLVLPAMFVPFAAACGDDDAVTDTGADASADADAVDGTSSADGSTDDGGTGATDAQKDTAAPSAYCQSTLDYSKRCFPNISCNTLETCDYEAAHSNAALVQAYPTCRTQDTTCNNALTCALNAAASAPHTAQQTTFAQDYCAQCGTEIGAGCTTKIFAIPDAGKLTAAGGVLYLVSDSVLDKIDKACLQSDGGIDAGPDARSSDGGRLSCDQRLGACARAVVDGMGGPKTTCTAK